MALSDTYQPFAFYFEIAQGAHFHLEFPPFVDVTTGDPFDFVDDGPWTGRVDVRTRDGVLVTSFATSGATGTVSLGSDGIAALDMAALSTGALDATTSYSGSQTGAPLVAELRLTDHTDGEPWLWAVGRGRIRKQVTGG